MYYEYKCVDCGCFVRKEDIEADHKAVCDCGRPATRVYSLLGWSYNNPISLYNSDGSYKEKL